MATRAWCTGMHLMSQVFIITTRCSVTRRSRRRHTSTLLDEHPVAMAAYRLHAMQA